VQVTDWVWLPVPQALEHAPKPDWRHATGHAAVLQAREDAGAAALQLLLAATEPGFSPAAEETHDTPWVWVPLPQSTEHADHTSSAFHSKHSTPGLVQLTLLAGFVPAVVEGQSESAAVTPVELEQSTARVCTPLPH